MSVTIRDLMTNPDLFGGQFDGTSWATWRTLLNGLNPRWRGTLWKNARQLKSGLRRMGLEVHQSDIPITAFTLESSQRNQQVREQLLNRNIFIQRTTYPGASPGGMLRIVVFSTHSEEQITHLLNELGAII